MNKNVVIIDSGCSNILNVCHAFEYCGANVSTTRNANDIIHADYLVLPGVGTFGQCMDALHRFSLVEPIIKHTQLSKPFLGICVGMQVLFETGFEFGQHKGLGLIPGVVNKIPDAYDLSGKKNAIPHIGWYELIINQSPSINEKHILSGLPDSCYSYFLHSYMAELKNKNHLIAYYQYGELKIPALVKKESIYGSQFHLEKSGKIGLEIIKNFLSV